MRVPESAGRSWDPTKVARGLFVLVLFFYGVAIAHYGSALPAGCDTAGYINTAVMLSELRATEPLRAPWGIDVGQYRAGSFIPLGLAINEAGELAASYPVGLPLEYAVLSWVVGWRNAVWLHHVLVAVLLLLFAYLLALELGLGHVWALALSLLIGFFPNTVLNALQPMSDVTSAAWCAGAFWAALRSRRSRPWLWAGLAGVFFGLAVLVRPTDVLLLAGLVLALWPHWRAWLALVVGGLPAAVFLAVYNSLVYGTVLAAGGYGNVSSEFSTANVGAATTILFGTMHDFWGVWFWLGLVLAGVVAVTIDRRVWALLAASVPLWVFYSFYSSAGSGWFDFRFVLPTVTLLGCAAALGWSHGSTWLAGRLPWPDRAARLVPVIGLVTVLVPLWTSVPRALGADIWVVAEVVQVQKNSIDRLTARLPEQAAVFASEISGVLFHAGFPIIYFEDLEEGEAERMVTDVRAAGGEVFAMLFDFERSRLLERTGLEWRTLVRHRTGILLMAPVLEEPR